VLEAREELPLFGKEGIGEISEKKEIVIHGNKDYEEHSRSQ
jgi:hypothetical protein